MAATTIEWTEATWNPVTGCSKISPGCLNCYAERMAHRLKAMGQPNYVRGFEVNVHEATLSLPLSWKRPRTIFVNSMGDLFHDRVPEGFIHAVFDVMVAARWHCFQVLTKRSERLLELAPSLPWPDNVWMGVSVENGDYRFRLDHLRRTPARVKFASLEPLLGPLPNLDLGRINWIIVGGESGPRARAMDGQWVRDIRDQCLAANVPFFFKQWGGFHKKRAGRLLDGRVWDYKPSGVPVGGAD
ncbi:phage Gp37/Gp68 family protein [bacterium]|nr:phage Gp37/Gp68 family protein [bacterium]